MDALRVMAATPATPEPEAAFASDERPTIAILPFANLGGDPEQSYFSDGFSEDLITELSRWRTLQVRSRSASFRFRGVGLDMRLGRGWCFPGNGGPP